MSLHEIVNVTITRETKAVSRQGFGIALVLGSHRRFPELIKYYSQLSSMLIVNGGDFESTDKEYIAAAPLFAQEKAVVQVAVGRREVSDSAIMTIAAVENNTLYETTINGTTFQFTSDADATDDEITAGLTTAINLGSEPITAVDNVDGTYTLTADVAGTPYSLSHDSNQSTPTPTPTDTITNDLAAIKNENDTWYGLILTSRTQADQEEAALWTESNKKFSGYGSNDINTINQSLSGDTTSLAKKLKDASYVRSFVIYHPDAATIYPESAVFGQILPRNPGSYTAMFKSLAGIAVVDLTDTQSRNARDKNCMIYTEVGGANITQEGQTAEGEFIDVIIFVDWLRARITENVYSRFVNLPKIPFTDAGIAIVEAELKTVLQLGIERGGIAEDPAFTVTVPLAAGVSTADKALRLLPDVEFEATLAGAIHAVTINGRVVL